jgi:hypothetical protein
MSAKRVKKCEFLISLNINITIRWDVTPCSVVDRYKRLGGACCFKLRVRGVGVTIIIPETIQHVSLNTGSCSPTIAVGFSETFVHANLSV